MAIRATKKWSDRRVGYKAVRSVFLPVLCVLATSTVASAQATFTIRGTVEITGATAQRPSDLSEVVVFMDAHKNLNSKTAATKPSIVTGELSATKEESGPTEGTEATKATEAPIAERPQIVQKDKKFSPKLLVVAQGTTVEFPNWDPFTHNVFSRSRAARFDLDRYPQGVSKSYTFENAGLVQIFCNIHPNMRAVILVVPNRYFARTNAEGRFEIRDLPTGSYNLIAWHARTGGRGTPVDVGPNASNDNIAISLVQPGISVGPAPSPRRRHSGGVSRGLGIKREQLNLPVVGPSHPAPPAKQRR